MDINRLLQIRLANQQLTQSTSQSVQETVSRLGAVQSQEFPDAKWSVARRTPGLTQAAFDEAFNDGSILRTHVLRPTWHFVAPADIRWMLALTAPRIKAFVRTNERKLGLDEALFSLSNRLIEKALANGHHLTRLELAEVLKQAGVPLVTNALVHLLMRAELEGIICSGAMRGRHHTYALLAQRAPQARLAERHEALATLAMRYFTSHGPATVHDYSWWSGLTLTDARIGLDSIKTQLVSDTIEGRTYWYVPSGSASSLVTAQAHLLPNFDEYVVAYADRTCLLTPSYAGPLSAPGAMLAHRTIVLNGQVTGTWKVDKTKATRTVTVDILRSLTDVEETLLEQGLHDYRVFYGQSV